MKISLIAGAFSARYRRCCLLLTLTIACAPCLFLQAAQTDVVPEQELNVPALAVLTSEGERKAEATARYMAGILEEEASGPEKAFESYRRVLDLEPGFSELALYIARDHLRRGESAEAIGVLKDALKANPKDMNLSLALASIYLRQLQKPDIALKYAQRANEIYPDEYAPYEAFYEIYQLQSQKARARQMLDRAAQSKSTSPYFWLQLGTLTVRDYTDSEKLIPEQEISKITLLFEKAQEYSYDDSAVIAEVAGFFTLTKQNARAISLYEGLLKNNPDFPDICEDLGLCYSRLGEIDKAIATYQKAVAKDPVKGTLFDNLAALYLQKKDEVHALYSLRQGLLIDPYDPGRYEMAGKVALRLHKAEDAIQIFRNARARFAGVPEFTYLLASALAQDGQYYESMRALDQVIYEASNIKPSLTRPSLLDARFYLDYGRIANEAKLYSRAEEMLRKSIEMNPANSAEASNDLAYMLAERGEKLDEAEVFIRNALVQKPNEGAYLDSLGWVLYKQNRYPEALAELLGAASHFTKPDPVIYEHIGDVYQKMGQLPQAVLYWQKANQLAPENKELLVKIDENAKKVAGAAPAAAPTSKTPGQRAPE
ncbi:MAG: tetratricopeptide repeat protein [Chthoniobacterales bacterium]